MSFKSKSLKRISDSKMQATGNLSIRGKLNRFDFDLQWNALTEAGRIIVSNEVKIEILAEFKEVNESVKAV